MLDITPRARGHVFVLVALASHKKRDLRYFNGASESCFRDFSLKKYSSLSERSGLYLELTPNLPGPTGVEQHSFQEEY